MQQPGSEILKKRAQTSDNLKNLLDDKETDPDDEDIKDQFDGKQELLKR